MPYRWATSPWVGLTGVEPAIGVWGFCEEARTKMVAASECDGRDGGPSAETGQVFCLVRCACGPGAMGRCDKQVVTRQGRALFELQPRMDEQYRCRARSGKQCFCGIRQVLIRAR